ncbi:MAG: glycosyltransferase [Candidatus Pseudobacter hemicellulosilyticus]|uniref:Glycosyltransferase n=1 Tax=Candidatus Pseudobacter hemicellulosilyticus TaxID=3121375 RepID=A0AAJ5WUW1_9BACT|nr:MAG: glycosyltransferase [Pseudobacter sp.]
MKYWLLTTEFPPYYGGGISTYCYHTARMLCGQGHSVTVFIPDAHPKAYAITQQDGIRIISFNSNNGLENTLGYVPNLSYAFAIIVMDFIRKEGKPDYIESQEYLAIPYYLLQFKLLGYPEFQEVPVILTLHSPAFLYLLYNREGVYEFPNYWTGELEKSCIRSADFVIAPSQYIIGEIKEKTALSIKEEKSCIVPNPYMLLAVPPSANKITRNKLIFFGKLSPQKGVFELFAYFKGLWDAGFPHPLLVIGGTEKVYYPEMKTMGQLIRNNYAPYFREGKVTLRGKIHPSEKEAVLADAHVIIIPSMNDNLPYAAIEAMSMGKVVLASRQGGQREIIENGSSGFLFDHAIPGDFEQKLQEVLSLSDEALAAIGKEARRKIQQLLSYEAIYPKKMAALAKAGNSPANNRHFPFITPMEAGKPAPDNGLKPDLLSVVIPFYNLGAYIKDCVHSILQSSYAPIEVIIINDGSSNTESLLALKEMEQHPAVRIIHRQNEGLTASRNYGARLASGTFMAFLDADDMVHPAYYSKAIQVLRQYDNVSFVGAWVKYFGLKKGYWPTWNPEPPYILLHNSVNSSALVYKTTAFLKGGLNDRAVSYGFEDYESVVNMLDNGFRGVVLPELLFNYRIRKNSMYRKVTRYKTLYAYEYIIQKHATLYKAFAKEIVSLQNANGPAFSFDNPSLPVRVTSSIQYPNAFLNRIKQIVKRNKSLKQGALKIYNLLKK